MGTGVRVAIIATDGVEEAEIVEPMRALKESGAEVHVISLQPGSIQAMQKDVNPGQKIAVDHTIDGVKAADFDVLVLPGGTTNPDKLRLNRNVITFVQEMARAQKPIAAICHGPWTLIEARCVFGKRMTSWPSLQTDLRNAGASWVDEECVVDGQLITSRNPNDLPAFIAAILDAMEM